MGINKIQRETTKVFITKNIIIKLSAHRITRPKQTDDDNEKILFIFLKVKRNMDRNVIVELRLDGQKDHQQTIKHADGKCCSKVSCSFFVSYFGY